MSKWIKVNLPWYKQYKPKNRVPSYPTNSVEKKVIEKFGNTGWGLCEDFKKKFKKEYYNVIDVARHKESFSDDVEDVVLLSYPTGKSPAVKAAIKLRQTIKDIKNFECNLPMVIKWLEKCQKIADEIKTETDKMSFNRSELCRPGVLIEVEDVDGGKPKQYLIGDINVLGGVCNDCMEFSNDSIVLRAKILI